MREIMFRAKRLDNGEWVDGFVLFNHDKSEAVIAKLTDTESVCENVVPNTVGQFTGLHDKNGKEIYEGDIISRKYTIGPQCCFSEEKEEINYIGFRQSECKFIVVCANRHHDLYERYNIHVEVIGNIHDNPELLKSL